MTWARNDGPERTETVDTTEGVAAGSVSHDDFAVWFQQRLVEPRVGGRRTELSEPLTECSDQGRVAVDESHGG